MADQEFTVESGRVSFTSPRPYEAPSATAELTFSVAPGVDYDAVMHRLFASVKAQVYGVIQAPATATLPQSVPAERAKRGAKAAPVTAVEAMGDLVIGGTADQTEAAKAAVLAAGKAAAVADPMLETASSVPSPGTALVVADTASPMDAGSGDEDVSGLFGSAEPAEITDEVLEKRVLDHVKKFKDGKAVQTLAAAFGIPPGGKLFALPAAQRPVFLSGLDKLGANGAMA